MLSEEEVVTEILKEIGAFLTGHFQLTSGKHSDQYVEKIKIIQHPEKSKFLAFYLGQKLIEASLKKEATFSIADLDYIVSPAFGAITLGFDTARELEVKFAFTQRNTDGKMIMRSGFDLKPGMKVIIIEDITTTGNSILEVLEVLEAYGVEIMAIGLIVDRSNGKVKENFNGISFIPLLTLDITTYDADKCPLCKKKIPLVKPGSSGKK